ILAQNKINFDTIQDAASYQNIVGQINTTIAKFPNDSGLSATETQFASDVMHVREELATVKTRIDGLLANSMINQAIAFSGDSTSQLKTNLITTSNNIATNLSDLDKIRFTISNQ